MPVVLALLATAAALAAQHAPMPRQEFRGAWIATVSNIDWPSSRSLSPAQAKQELLAIVDRAALLRLNALVFQVRPTADALYRSDIEPWAEWLTGAQGRAPNPPWDPLQFLIEAAVPRGIEVHAWCNPYRARHPAAKSPAAAGHVSRVLPDAVVRYGSFSWMDPGDPRAADWSLRVMQDLVRRYDLDGIHLDDYFYPYPEKQQDFPDTRSYLAYRRGGGRLRRGDWRRHNIDSFLERLYESTHREKPWIRVGISPFGIARPGLPAGIAAGIDQYHDLSADVLGWQRKGLCDYLAPQLYWPIDQKKQSYSVLLPWWTAQNPLRRHVWPGLSASRARAGKAPWRREELSQQIEMIRQQQLHAPGHILFSFKALHQQGGDLARELLAEVYQQPAPPPACPWLECTPPAAPTVEVLPVGDRPGLEVTVDQHARFVCVQALHPEGWRTETIRGGRSLLVALPAGVTRATVRPIARNGTTGPPTTVEIPR